MVQPLKDNAPSFMLLTFGQPDFDYKICMNRIFYIKDELKKQGIDVIGWSSDGDPKLLKAMTLVSKIGDPKNKIPIAFKNYINADFETQIACIQDECHICNKLKNRLMVQSDPIVMGYNGCNACMAHLLLLDQQKLKSKTKLTSADLTNADPMSSNQAIKLASDCVLDTLKEIDDIGTRPTRLYLLLIKEQHLALSSKTLSPLERIQKLFFVIFILRAIYNERSEFKRHIRDFKSSQFITANAYKCLELNAANMLVLARKLRDNNDDKYFLPWLFQSQTCESYFRLLRSFTPNQSTITNFHGLEGQYKMTKVQTMIDLGLSLSEKGFILPIKYQNNDNSSQTNTFKIPNDEILANEIKKAREQAMQIMAEFLLRPSSNEKLSIKKSFSLDLDSYKYLYNDLDTEEQEENTYQEDNGIYSIEYDDCFENQIQEAMTDPVMVSDIDLLSECDGLLTNSLPGDPLQGSNYLCVKDNSGKQYFISTKTYVWLINNPQKLSNDRLKRFRATSAKINEYFRKEQTAIEKLKNIMKLDFIVLNCRIAQVLDFRYIETEQKKGKNTIKSIRYKWNSLDIDSNKKSKQKVGLLVQFYNLKQSENEYVLQRSSDDCNQLFIDSESYQTHLPKPTYRDGLKTYSLNTGRHILEVLKLDCSKK